MVDANVPDIALEPDKTVKKVSHNWYLIEAVPHWRGKSLDSVQSDFLKQTENDMEFSNWLAVCQSFKRDNPFTPMSVKLLL